MAAYWDYFNPSFLFFAGDTGLINGTRYTGVFLLPLLILLPVGLVRLFRTIQSPSTLLVALCLLTAPLAASARASKVSGVVALSGYTAIPQLHVTCMVSPSNSMRV